MNFLGSKAYDYATAKSAHGGERSDFFLLIQGFPIGVAK
jgi:hypothetical protein